jgi:hypothetical protein
MAGEIVKDDEAFRAGFLLSTREKQIAKARADALTAKAQMEAAIAQAESARHETYALRVRSKARAKTVRTIFAWLAVILLSAATGRIAYIGYTRSSPPTVTPTSDASTPAATEEEALPPPVAQPSHSNSSAGDPMFKKAMSRLQSDFDSAGEDQSELVREVNKKYGATGSRPCPLEWVNGEAALSLDGDNGRIAPSLSVAVTGCANAIEKFRAEKASPPQAADQKNR